LRREKMEKIKKIGDKEDLKEDEKNQKEKI